MRPAILRRTFLLCLFVAVPFAQAQESGHPGLPEGFQRMEWKVDGVAREALVYAPATAREKPAPLVFVFHGHGGTMPHAARAFAIHTHWPEAISVYPQGLNTPGRLTDPEGKRPGWQAAAGAQGDRDLKFFDAMMTKLQQEFKVDARRLYSTGHSNGGSFTYLLWAERGDAFAAMAPSAAVMLHAGPLKPKPVMHLAGEKDSLVKFEWQQRMMLMLRKRNGCEGDGQPFGSCATRYASPKGPPVVTFIHPGGHEFHPDGPALIVKFFKAHAR